MNTMNTAMNGITITISTMTADQITIIGITTTIVRD